MKRVKDVVQERSLEDVESRFRDLEKSSLKLAKAIETLKERSDLTVVMVNFLYAIAAYSAEISKSTNGHVSVTAICTRSLYELNLRIRDVVASPDGLKRWMSEAITDHIQLLDGILRTSDATPGDPRRRVLESETARLNNLRTKYQLDEEKPLMASEMAKKADMKQDHDALYKIFSKLSHPTSLLVNSPKSAGSLETRNILYIRAQMAAMDSINRIGASLDIPMSTFWPPTSN